MPIRLSEIPQGPIRLSEIPQQPSPVLQGIKRGLEIASWPQRTVAKGAWKGLGQPFFNVYGKLSGLVGGPAVALQETNWPIPTSPLQILPNIVGQERNMMKPVEGLKHIAKTTIAPLRGIPIVNLWQEPHPDTRGVGQIPMAYAKRMIGEEPKGLTKAFAIAGGVGAEYLVTPQLVSSTFKGAARLGRATPWYKTWAASRLPKLENLMLEFGADKAEGIEQARELGRTVRIYSRPKNPQSLK
ncbi:MAG: hypothetical protein ACYS30_18120 [Planctomycetota bacterium]